MLQPCHLDNLTLHHVPYDRLGDEVTAQKAARTQAEEECLRLHEQMQNLQLQLQASEVAASGDLAPSNMEVICNRHLTQLFESIKMHRFLCQTSRTCLKGCCNRQQAWSIKP